MAYEIPGLTITLEAGSTVLEQFQFVAVSSTAANRVVDPTTGARIAGVLTNDPTVVGQAATIQVAGVAKVLAASSTKSFGDFVHTNAVGRIQTIAPTTNDHICGQVVKGTSAGSTRCLSVLLKDFGMAL